MLSNEVLQHSIRAIVQHLDGNVNEFQRLSNMAVRQHEIDQYNSKCIVTIGEVTPVHVRKQMYRIASRREQVC